MEFIVLIGIAYVVLLLALAVFQRSVMYFPDRNVPTVPTGAELITVTSDDGLAIPAWYQPPAYDQAPVIVWFHGNAGHLGYFWPQAVALTRQGAGLLMPEYRSYGGAPGKPSEAALVADGKAFVNALKSQGLPSDRIVLYGLSLGSGIAVQVAHNEAKNNEPVAGVVLESPYSSTLDIARWRFPIFPVSLFMKDTYKSTDFIDKISAPLLVLHGDADGIIPYRFGQKLFRQAAAPKEFVTIPGGGHVNLFGPGMASEDGTPVLSVVLAFLDQVSASGVEAE
ncbi:MAG: alpha/beta hydrolase [Pseudomonadota bacterium]